MDDVVESVELSTAEELLGRLRPTDPLWSKYLGRWIFRGQFCSELPLLPSAFRTESWVDFAKAGEGRHDPNHATAVGQEREEYELLLRLYLDLDRGGLEIPNDMFVRCYLEETGKAYSTGSTHDHRAFLTDPAIATFAALAQHHGVPTRLLDWTRVGLHADYFAAATACLDGAEPIETRRLAVWALPVDFIEQAKQACDVSGRPLPELRVLHAPRGSNPNLHAQVGLFTVWFTDSAIQTMENVVRELVTNMNERRETRWWDAPPLKRLTVPWSEAPKLLRLLSNEQVHAARLFPGRDGVVRFLKEQSLWDTKEGSCLA